MRAPYEWLKQFVSVEATAEEVATKLTMGGLEVEGIEESAIGPVLDVYVTPNRGDCNSIVGVAREVAALYDLKLSLPLAPPSNEEGAARRQTTVTIEAPDLCPRYAARLIRGVKVEPSPPWMQARLEAAGQRPINNIVDVTNYVLLELGQPLHAFDLKKLSGERIVVRTARAGETITTLDGQERALAPEMLVIADAEKPVAIAGVMGGADTEVGEETTDILLESAHFNSLSVRRTSRALGLRTEASYRFERVVDPDGVRRAVDRACQLLTEMGQPEAVEGIIDAYPHPIENLVLTLRIRRTETLLGMDVPSHVAADCLRRLGFQVLTEPHGATDTLKVQVPTFRPDITQEEDLVEEVGRVYGYENIPETLPIGVMTQGGDSAEGRFLRRIRDILVGCGLQEVITHSLTAPAFFDPEQEAARVAVRNALSADISGLRASLIPTLLDVAERNATRGQHGVAIFEIGRVWQDVDGEPVESISVAGLLTGLLGEAGWQPGAGPPLADFFLARGIVERLLSGLAIPIPAFVAPQENVPTPAVAVDGKRISDSAAEADACTVILPLFHPGRAAAFDLLHEAPPDGVLGEIHPAVQARVALRDRVYAFEIALDALLRAAPQEGPRFQAISRYPAVTRDLAPRVDADRPYGLIEETVREAGQDIPTLEAFRLTDVYSGPGLPEGKISYTLSFAFRSPERTLTDSEVNDALARIRGLLEERCGATFAG